MKLEMLGTRILVRNVGKRAEKTKGGIIMPANRRHDGGRDCHWSTVLAVGPGEYNPRRDDWRRMDVNPGYTVYHGEFVGFFVEHEGEELLAIDEADVVAINRRPPAFGLELDRNLEELGGQHGEA